MGKSRNLKEWDDVQKLKAENKKLKTQISKLRKVISRLDYEQYTNMRELLDAQKKQDETYQNEQKQVDLEKKWQCYECDTGVMRLVILHRAGEPYYTRRCDNCDNKTKLKKYTEEIKGV